jgi:hypothetical protein
MRIQHVLLIKGTDGTLHQISLSETMQKTSWKYGTSVTASEVKYNLQEAPFLSAEQTENLWFENGLFAIVGFGQDHLQSARFLLLLVPAKGLYCDFMIVPFLPALRRYTDSAMVNFTEVRGVPCEYPIPSGKINIYPMSYPGFINHTETEALQGPAKIMWDKILSTKMLASIRSFSKDEVFIPVSNLSTRRQETVVLLSSSDEVSFLNILTL